MTTLSVKISGTEYLIKNRSFKLPDRIEERSTCNFTVRDANGAYHFNKGQPVTVDDALQGRLFTGSIHTIKRLPTKGTSSLVWHEIECDDLSKILDEKESNEQFEAQYAGAIAVQLLKNMWTEGIYTHCALDVDDTLADWVSGTHSGTVATTNVDNGCLELAPAGSQVSIIETDFSTGTLTNMTGGIGSLAPTATPAMKIVAVQSVAGLANAYTYIKFTDSGFGVGGSRYIAYDIWIDPSSPEAKIGVDLVFDDGSAWRDQAVYFDQQHKSNHPGTDLAGLATGQWYHRKILLDNVSSKNVDYAMIGVEGEKPGTYTAWIKNVYKVDVNDVIKNTLFAGTLLTDPPEQMQNAGYSSTTLTIVNTYDCTSATRVSPSYSIDAVKLLKSSFITTKTTLSTGYSFNLSYSLDNGHSYTQCSNNTALPNLPPGLSVAGKNIQFLQSFLQGSNAQPDQQPLLNSLQLIVQPSYSASKSDVTYEATTNGEWNAGTFTNTQAPGTILQLIGYARNWHNGPQSGQTLFGGKATGPNTSTTCLHYVDSRQLRLFCYQLVAGWSRFDFAGQFADGIIDCDFLLDRGSLFVGFVYRTNSTSNYDAQYGYCVEVTTAAVYLVTGDNSNSASDGTRTVLDTYSIAISQAATHRLRIVFLGSTHQIYLDSVLIINKSDSTYLSAGYCGPRISNTDPSNGYIGAFNNFGIMTSLSGTWLSPSTSLSVAGTYGGSIVTWQDVSTNAQSTKSLVESTINGGSTWQTVVNGGSIPSLTIGQSLSGVSVKFRVTLTTATAAAMPQVQYLVARILGQFSSSGTRISSALLLDGVGRCGSTLVAWDEIKPIGTSVAVATSLGGSYTDTTNGGTIAGISTTPDAILDSFEAMSGGSYTRGNFGGVNATITWDPPNSRITGISGNYATLLYSTALTFADNRVWADFDQADGSGIITNYQDDTQSYFLQIWDSAASGLQNKVKLFKRSGSGGGSGYGYKKAITIDHTKVIGGSNHTSFPMRVSLTDADLKTAGNGGNVQNANGYDIIFMNALETTQLDHEIEKYVSTTGEIEMWVRIPTLSVSSDTVIYVYFGNNAISSSQENVHGVWDASFKGVWHLGNGSTLSVSDSTSNGNNGTNHGATATTGQIDGGASFNGNYIDVGTGSSLDITNAITLSCWINSQNINQAWQAIVGKQASGNGYYSLILPSTSQQASLWLDLSGYGWGSKAQSNTVLSGNTWYYIVGTYDSSSGIASIYINGALDNSSIYGNNIISSAGTPVYIGQNNFVYFNGYEDEVRVSDVARSAGWIATEYNNQSSPSTFYSIGSITPTSGGLGNVQLGSTAVVSFTRGTYKRFSLDVQAGILTAYMDNVQLIQYTDSSPLGAGKSGLLINTLARVYNLRIQQYGQDLTGVKAYTKITLDSTDPLYTPQITNFTTLVTNPNVQAGALVPTADYRNTYQSDNINDLAKRSNYPWNVLADGSLLFRERKAEPAPWILSGDDILVEGFDVEDSGDLYRNRQIMTGVIATASATEELKGDGKRTSWVLQYNAVSVSSLTLNGKSVSFGLKGETGKDFYYEVGSNSIAQDSSGVLLQETDLLIISYVGRYETTVARNNTGQFAGTVSQAQYRVLRDLSIPVIPLLNLASAAHTTSGASDDLDVNLCKQIAFDANITAHSGSSPTVQFFIERKDLSGNYVLLWQSAAISASSAQVSRSIGVGCETPEALGTTIRLQWIISGSTPSVTFFASILGKVDPGLAGIGVVTAIEDVSGQNMDVASAENLADSRLKEHGVIGRTIRFGTRRTGLRAGQYLNIFFGKLGIVDMATLIVNADMTQKLKADGNQDYWYQVEAVEGSVLPSWSKALNDNLKK